MRHLLITLVVATTFLSFSTIEKNDLILSDLKKNEISKFDCRYGQCQATAKSTGKQCKHCVSNSGDKFCYQHK